MLTFSFPFKCVYFWRHQVGEGSELCTLVLNEAPFAYKPIGLLQCFFLGCIILQDALSEAKLTLRKKKKKFAFELKTRSRFEMRILLERKHLLTFQNCHQSPSFIELPIPFHSNHSIGVIQMAFYVFITPFEGPKPEIWVGFVQICCRAFESEMLPLARWCNNQR